MKMERWGIYFFLTWVSHFGRGRLQFSPPGGRRACFAGFLESLFSHGVLLERWSLVLDEMSRSSMGLNQSFFSLCFWLCSLLKMMYVEGQSFGRRPFSCFLWHQNLPHVVFFCQKYQSLSHRKLQLRNLLRLIFQSLPRFPCLIFPGLKCQSLLRFPCCLVSHRILQHRQFVFFFCRRLIWRLLQQQGASSLSFVKQTSLVLSTHFCLSSVEGTTEPKAPASVL